MGIGGCIEGRGGEGLNLHECKRSYAEGVEGPETNGTTLITLLIIEANYSIINGGAAKWRPLKTKCAKSTTTNDLSYEKKKKQIGEKKEDGLMK